MISYIVACEYINGIKSYITNVDPVLWSRDIAFAKRFYSIDDMINDLRFDMDYLYGLLNNHEYIKDIYYIEYNDDKYICSKRLIR